MRLPNQSNPVFRGASRIPDYGGITAAFGFHKICPGTLPPGVCCAMAGCLPWGSLECTESYWAFGDIAVTIASCYVGDLSIGV